MNCPIYLLRCYISFLNCDEWCRNEFQVTNQISIEGKRKNRYDVTILINGLSLVQIELKKRDSELKVAFHQINRHQHESYDAGAGLFQYVQLFIISNGVNTKYFANNKFQAFQQTFYWTDKENNRIEDYVTQFNEAAIALLKINPTIKSVDTLADENKKLEFVTQFRELLRLKNVLTTFYE